MCFKLRWVGMAGILTVSLLLAGCDDDTSEPEKTGAGGETTADELEKDIGQAADTAAEYAAEQKEKFLQEADASLDDLEQKISDWREQAEQKGDQASEELEEQQAELQQRLEDARKRMDELQDKSGEAWNEASADLQQAIDDLEKAWQDASAEFDSDPQTAPE